MKRKLQTLCLDAKSCSAILIGGTCYIVANVIIGIAWPFLWVSRKMLGGWVV